LVIIRRSDPISAICDIIMPSTSSVPEHDRTGANVGIEVNFEGKIAMVTGASSGLGARFAKALAGAGAQVVLASRRTERLKELRAEIEADGGAAHVVNLDVTDLASIKSAIAHAETEAGPIDILINNSGVQSTQRLLDVTEDDYQYIMDTNLRGAFFVAQQTAKRMIQRAKGDPRKQHRIVNIASVAGLRVLPQIGVYCMSKAAECHLPRLHRHRDERGIFRDRAGQETDRAAAAQAPGQAGRPGWLAAPASRRGSAFHQRCHHHCGRRYDGPMKGVVE
jgi:NADP-dependent 3-hydroxy acid dehydrogenase YdfG